MKKYYLILFLFSNFLSAQKKQILFIGNSLTYYYDMPKMLSELLNESSDKFNVVQLTFPGIQIQHYIENGGAKSKLEETNWDYVFLQTGTTGFLIPESVKINIIPSIEKILSFNKKKDCHFYFFSTWVIKTEYPYEICYPKILFSNSATAINGKFCSPVFKNSFEQKKYLDKQYAEIAKITNVEFTRNSDLEYQFEKKYPFYKMWDDQIHPSKIGSFFNSCIFYKLITNADLTKTKFNSDISPDITNNIKNYIQNNY